MNSNSADRSCATVLSAQPAPTAASRYWSSSSCSKSSRSWPVVRRRGASSDRTTARPTTTPDRRNRQPVVNTVNLSGIPTDCQTRRILGVSHLASPNPLRPRTGTQRTAGSSGDESDRPVRRHRRGRPVNPPIMALAPLAPPTPTPPAPSQTPVVVPAPTRWLEHAAVWFMHRPWLALLLPAGLIVYIAGRNLLASWRHRHHAADARLVTIAPPPEVDPANAAALWANLAGILTPSRRRRLLYGSPHVVFQYMWTGRHLLISIWVPGTVPHGAVEAAVRGAWPGATVTTEEPAADPIPAKVDAQTGGHLLPTAAEWLPLRTDHDADPLRALMAAGSQLHGGEYACVQILARPATPRRANRARRAAGRLRDGKTAAPTLNPAAPLLWLIEIFQPAMATRHRSASTGAAPRRDHGVERDVRAILDKTAHPLWETGIRYAVATTTARNHTRDETATLTARVRGIADAIASSC